MFLNIKNFDAERIAAIKKCLEKIDDDKYFLILGICFKNPKTTFILSIFSLDRFYLHNIVSGILKIIISFSVIGLIWWIIDMCTTKGRTARYNFKRFMKVVDKYVMIEDMAPSTMDFKVDMFCPWCSNHIYNEGEELTECPWCGKDIRFLYEPIAHEYATIDMPRGMSQ